MEFTVYKITNKINDKCYIGSSIRIYHRWNEEKNNAYNQKSKSYNYPLQCAFRKYGLENFSFEILKNDFITLEEMWDYEYNMIIKFNSLVPNGYNQTLFTKCALQDPNVIQKLNETRAQKCALVDIDENILEVYPSYQEASRLNGYENSASKIREVCLGKQSSINGKIFRQLNNNNQVIHQPILPYKNRKKIIGIDPTIEQKNIVFESILKASNILGINRQSIQKCLKGDKRYSIVGGYIFRYLDDNNDIIPNKIDIDERIKEYNEKNPIIGNEQHTITEWCKIYNISTVSFYKRIKNGMSIIEALITPKRR